MGVGRIVKIVIGALSIGGAAYGLDSLAKKHIYWKGYNRLGFDREGYDRDGFDVEGYNKAGFDRMGFDKEGYDRDGYDINGLNEHGLGRDGYDPEGYDYLGYGRDGYNRAGFDRAGYNAEGYDRQGFDRSGYNAGGTDRGQLGREYYVEAARDIIEKNVEAIKQMHLHNFDYASVKIRKGLEKTIKCILAHKLGLGYENNMLEDNITVCEQHHCLEANEISNIRGAKQHCNDLLHEDPEKTYDQLHFCSMVLKETLESMLYITDIPLKDVGLQT